MLIRTCCPSLRYHHTMYVQLLMVSLSFGNWLHLPPPPPQGWAPGRQLFLSRENLALDFDTWMDPAHAELTRRSLQRTWVMAHSLVRPGPAQWEWDLWSWRWGVFTDKNVKNTLRKLRGIKMSPRRFAMFSSDPLLPLISLSHTYTLIIKSIFCYLELPFIICYQRSPK